MEAIARLDRVVIINQSLRENRHGARLAAQSVEQRQLSVS